MVLCDNGVDPFDFQSECVREIWGSFLPAGLVLVLCFLAIPIPIPHALDILLSPFKTYLTLHEAEALDGNIDKISSQDDMGDSVKTVPLWRTVVFVFVGVIQSLSWIVHGSYRLHNDPRDVFGGVLPFLVAIAWLYTIIRPISHPIATSPFDLFSIYLVLFCVGSLRIGGILFDHNVFGSPWPSTITLVALSANLLALLVLLIVVLNIPLALPSNRINKKDIGYSISPENYTSLWGWITFSWVYPLIRRGRYTTLNESDVWNLSPTIQSRPIFVKFSSVHRSTLLRRIWAANSLDIILNLSLNIALIILGYSGPFFLKKILDAIDLRNPTPESRAKAYIYAFLAFACALLKTQVAAQHLWFGRRAATRIHSELMASIYDKALKRKDFSGVTNKDKEEVASKDSKNKTKAQKKEEKDKAAKADDPKAGADQGKIANLIADDISVVSGAATSLSLICGAPLELVIGGIFLYQLLGLSAFAGFIVLIAGWPLNSFFARRSIKIQKRVLAAHDKRMGVLDELIRAIKFVKFFAWEERWINKVMDAREAELKLMVKGRFNSIIFYILYTLAPIFISIISFSTYVMLGNQLTIGAAFTAIALLNMMGSSLTAIPNWILQILQTRVRLKRISVYLDEEEVTDQVSSLKKDYSEPYLFGDDEGLGLECATFKWNEVVEVVENGKQLGQNKSSSSSTVSLVTDEASTPVVDAESIGDRVDRVFELRNMTIRFPEGKLTVVTGPTASGKTALLVAVLGEMTLVEGRIIMSKEPSRVDENGLMHSISYAAQSPWLRHQSIKDNILFGYPFEEERYKAVIECCALQPDLEALEDGDATEIGARGVNLSGGQKARVALARAVYARTKYVLLDDPLSAVDSHTSSFLYEKLLRGPLLANRTVVLVTHHVELVLPGAYYLVRMLDGRIETQGTVKELQAQGVLKGIELEDDAAVETYKEEVVVAETASIGAEESLDTTEVSKKPRKLVKDEHREIGAVKWSIYKSYLNAFSYQMWAFLVILIVVNQFWGITEMLWIKTWGEAYASGQDDVPTLHDFRSFATTEHEVPMDGHLIHNQLPHLYQSAPSIRSLFDIDWPSASQHPLFYVGIYAAIGLLHGFCTILSAAVQYTGALRASRILFKQLLVTVVRATFRFHDTTPQGRMINRFGMDMSTIDFSLASSLQALNSSLAGFFAAIITVSVVFPYFLVPAFFIGFAYRELAIGYLNTGRDLRRMESNTSSPIFSDFGELLEGIVTVRAFSVEKMFLNNVFVKIDTTTKMRYNYSMTTRWLILNFDALGSLSVLITSLFSISTLTNDAGLAGLCITSAMAFTTSVYWVCRIWTGLELDLNAVERVTDYLDLPQEPPAVIESHRVPAYWPSNSKNDSLLVAENIVVKYAPDLPAVLQDVSFTLKAGERVGLLGRTGSGKSTLAMSIFRFVDPVGGRIIIDGIDISTIGIHDLRSRLTFIPQDATLFSGTIRENLDPFGEHTDSGCLDALSRVQIITKQESQRNSQNQSIASSRTASRPPSVHASEREDTVDSSSNAATDVDTKITITLDTKVSAGGTNFSQGQRQLIVLARALLRRSSIVVLDEATSSIDFETDAKIQKAIREEFNDSLLLTVAHRLRTVIDYDRLLVLDKGQVAEFDTPWNLIQKEDGVLREMCLKSGTFEELEAVAKAKAFSA